VVWPTALAYHFYVSGQLPNAFFYLALLIVMAFWEVATAAVDLLHSGWIRYVARRQSSTDLPSG
jgi:hypothetical protein